MAANWENAIDIIPNTQPYIFASFPKWYKKAWPTKAAMSVDIPVVKKNKLYNFMALMFDILIVLKKKHKNKQRKKSNRLKP